MFPGVLQGGRRSCARCIQHTLETHGVITGGTPTSGEDSVVSLSFQEATDKFFDDVNLKQCIDDLHAAVVDAKLRKQKGEVRPDIWREDLHPRAATRARIIPLLEKQRERLLAELQEVIPVPSLTHRSSFPHPAGTWQFKATRRNGV